MSILFDGVYENLSTPWWSTGIANPANVEASTITVNAEPAGNILLTSVISSTTQFNAPLIFQRPAADPNAPSESLVMNLSDDVPTKLVNGEYISATKASGTAYDDIAVAGLQVYGDQTTSGNSGAHAYITGEGGNLVLAPKNSVFISSLQVSSLQVVNVISTTAGVANSYTANLWMSTPVIYAGSVSTNQISTNSINATTANISTINVSTLNAPNFTVSTVSSLIVDTKVTLTSTLSLLGSPTNVNLGLGNVIQGLVGGAATQALGVGIGGAGLITGAAALATGRTSGGVNSNIFQTVNGSTQLQFSTIGSAVSSIFLTVNSPNPLTTPGLEISTSQGVDAGTYCVRSVGDPLYITNNVSSIQMYGQWVPVIQPTATIPTVAISSLNVSSINNAAYPPGGGGGGIPSTLAASTITINGNQTQSGTGTFNWGGNTMSPTQVVLARPTAVNNTLTTTGAAFINAGATVNSGLTVASGGMTVSGGNVTVNNSLFAFQILQGQTIQATGSLSVGGGGVSIVGGGINMASGNLNMTSGGSVANITDVVVGQSMRANVISTNQISTFNINLTNINGSPYSGGGGIPSTLNASTINFNGGLNNLGSASIITNQISTNNINLVNINGSPYSPGGGAIPSTLNASTINVNGGLTVTNNDVNINNQTALKFNNSAIIGGGFGDFRIRLGTSASKMEFTQSSGNNDSIIMDLKADKTTRFYSTLLVRDSTWPIANPSGAAIRTYDVTDTIPYGSVLTSNVGAVNVNFTQPNVGVVAHFESGTDFRFRLGGPTNRMQFVQNSGNNDAIIMDLNANKTTRFYSTLLVRDSTWPSVQPSGAAIRTYDTSDPPYGSVITSNVSTFNLQSQGATIISLSTNTISTNAISTNGIVALTGNISSLTVSSVNGVQIPGSLGVPIGSITIWAGGTDNNISSQNFNIPVGWLLCDGSYILNSLFPTLVSILGSKYGYAGQSPPPGTTALPDLTFAVAMGTPYRNYTNSIIPSIPSFSIQATTSDSAYNTTSLTGGGTQISSLTTWFITSKIGPALNYGSLIPGNSVTVAGSSITFPNMYISSIIQYNGAANDTGFIVLRSIDGTPIPRVPTTSTIGAVGQGITGTVIGGDAPFFLGSPNLEGNRYTTRNQKGIEIGAHNHKGTADFNILGSVALPNTACGTGGFTQPNYQPYVSTLQSQNAAMPTAPNFLNMSYIIRAL